MAQNQYLGWALAGTANVLSYRDYAARGEVLTGVVPGIADDTLANTTWRQSSVIAAAIAQFIVENTNLDMLDDGNVEGVVIKLKSALSAILVTATPPLYTGADTSTNPAQVTVYSQQTLAGYLSNAVYIFQVNNDCSGNVQVSYNGLPSKALVGSGGLGLIGGEYRKGDIVAASYNGNQFTLLNDRTVRSTVTLSVPSQYGSINAAMKAAGILTIQSDSKAIIALAAGTFQVDQTTGPMYQSMPFGQRVQIVGAALTGSFPSATEIAAQGSKSARLTFLKTRFPTVINVLGSDGFQLKAGTLNLLSNVLFVLDGTAGHFGIKLGDFQNEVGSGTISLQNVGVVGAGQNGIDAQFGAFVQINNVLSVDCLNDGVRSAHNSNIDLNFGNLLSMFNGKNGLYLANGGLLSIDSVSGTIDLSSNTQSGAYAAENGIFNALSASGIRLNGNGQWGVYAYGQSQVNLPSSATVTGNTSGAIYAGLASLVTAAGVSLSGCSPAVNASGNQNSLIVN